MRKINVHPTQCVMKGFVMENYLISCAMVNFFTDYGKVNCKIVN